MTALPPIENRHVVAATSRKYKTNRTCSHPDCDKPTESDHHIWPRGSINSDSYWVLIEPDEGKPGEPIPHVTGLCGSGTTGHHGDIEEHRAWIKYEEGEFVLYESKRDPVKHRRVWVRIGPLDPQPWGWTEQPRKKRARKKGSERRKRRTWSLAVPTAELDHEGAGLLDTAIEQLEEKLGSATPRSPYYTLMDALNYTLLNAGPEDFPNA